MVMYLDTKLKIISVDEISKINNKTSNLELEPKTLLKNTLAHDANSIVIVDKINDQPINPVSDQGNKIVQRLLNIFEPIGIKVLDYIIVDQREETSISLKSKGLMPYSQFGMADYSKIEIEQFDEPLYEEYDLEEEFELEW